MRNLHLATFLLACLAAHPLGAQTLAVAPTTFHSTVPCRVVAIARVPAATPGVTIAPQRELGQTGVASKPIAVPDAWLWWAEPLAPTSLDGAALTTLAEDLRAAGAPALSLAGCTALRDDDLAAVGTVTTLRQLDLTGCAALTPKALTHLRPLTALRWLRSDDTGLGAAELAAVTDLAAASRAIDARVQAAMAQQDLVGLAVVIVADGRIAHARGHGLADRETNQPVRPTHTSFRWASISKPLTAVAALQLVEQGKLDLDADVRALVPEFPEKPWPITTRQLLTHQGGVVHYSNGKVIPTRREYATAHPFTDLVTALDKFKESPLICEPGTAHHYTTHGFMLAGAVVERAGKAPLWTQVRARIATPLGMTSLQPDYEWVEIAERTHGYRRVLGVTALSADTDVSWKLAGGGFTSTPIDLARFGQGLLQGSLMQPETQAAMFTAQSTRDGKRTGYGLGIGVGRLGDAKIVSHSGAQEKTRTFLFLVPERQVAVALMCNSEWAQLSPLVRDLATLALP